MDEEITNHIRELQAITQALDGKIEILKHRFKHHINSFDAHKEPIKE